MMADAYPTYTPDELPKMIEKSIIDKMMEYYENPAKAIEDNVMENTIYQIIDLIKKDELHTFTFSNRCDHCPKFEEYLGDKSYPDPMRHQLLSLYESHLYVKHESLIKYLIIIHIMATHAREMIKSEKYERLVFNLDEIRLWEIFRICSAFICGALAGIVTFSIINTGLKKSGINQSMTSVISVIVSIISTSFVGLKTLNFFKLTEDDDSIIYVKYKEEELSGEVKKILGIPSDSEIIGNGATGIPSEFQNNFDGIIKTLSESNKNPSIQKDIIEKYISRLLELIQSNNSNNIDITPMDPKVKELLNFHARFTSTPLIKEIDEIRKDSRYSNHANLLDFMKLSIVIQHITTKKGGSPLEGTFLNEHIEFRGYMETFTLLFIIILIPAVFKMFSIARIRLMNAGYSLQKSILILIPIFIAFYVSIGLFTDLGRGYIVSRNYNFCQLKQDNSKYKSSVFVKDREILRKTEELENKNREHIVELDLLQRGYNESIVRIIESNSKLEREKLESEKLEREKLEREKNALPPEYKDDIIPPLGAAPENCIPLHGGDQSHFFDEIDLSKNKIIYVIGGLICVVFVIILISYYIFGYLQKINKTCYTYDDL